jgi:hypothetical protein
VLKALEDEKNILITKINNNPELEKIINELPKENASVKTR